MNDRVKKMPFQYQMDTELRKLRNVKYAGISLSKMWNHITNGDIPEEEIIIIQLLYELEYLTADQIRRCHINNAIPPEYKRLPSREGKNPYRRNLKHLESLGIVVIYSLFSKEQQVGVKIYSLSSGARKWMKVQSGRYKPIFHQNVEPCSPGEETRDPTFGFTEEVLGKLARNQCHIKAVNNNGHLLAAYSPCRFVEGPLEVGFYQTHSLWSIYLVPIRRAPAGNIHLLATLEELMREIRIKNKEKYCCIIIAAETLEHTKEINPQLSKFNDQLGIPLFYVTDTHIKDEEVFEHIIHYPDSSDTSEYETITIDMSS